MSSTGSLPGSAVTATESSPLDGLPAHVVIRQLYLGCLSQASYLVGDASTGRAIAVDPRRDVADLLAAAAEHGLTIELVVETHFHADFLSGHLELAAATGATVAVGAAGTTEFPSQPLADGDVLDLGGVQVEVIATPGHTPESICLVVRPAPDAPPVAVLTGDTLFIGDVGRPDLLAAADVPPDQLARQLHGSVQRLLELPDHTLVLPAHGAGSACGKALSTDTVSTIGAQRRSNYALQPMPVDEFVALVTEGQPVPPAYFAHDAALNRADRPLFEQRQAVPELTLAQAGAVVAEGGVIVDVRSPDEFARGHIAGALNVGLAGRFAEQVGSIVPIGTPVVIAGPAAMSDEARTRLARIGFDSVVGVLADPERVVAAHPERAARLSRLTAAELQSRRAQLGAELQLVDVRNPGEVTAPPLPDARNIPLARLRASLDELDRARPVVLVCAAGSRSAIASSMLLAAGFHDVSDVLGGARALAGTPADTP